MKYYSSLITLCITVLLLSALQLGCTPHPASGVWKATEENDYGISQLIVAFDGKANFTTTKPENAEWHCFWNTSGEQEAELKCTPSINPEQEEQYILTVDDQGVAKLLHNTQQIASFIRQNENPSAEN